MSTNFQQLEQQAARQGVVLTAKDRERIGELQNAERARLSAIAKKSTSRLDRFNAGYGKFLSAMLHAANLALALTRTIIVSAGVPVVLLLLLIVEKERLVSGLLLFEQNPHLADFGAWAIVITNVSLEFLAEYVEVKTGWKEPARARFSLRILAARLSYVLGRSAAWERQEQSPALRYKKLLSLFTVGILALALGGSMRAEIASTAGTWYEALRSILEASTLLQMTTWLAGLLFAFMAIAAAQGLSRYVAVNTSAIIAELQHEQHEQNDFSAAFDAVASAYLQNKMAAKQARDASKRADVPSNAPILTDVYTHQGNGTNGKTHGF